MGRARRQLPGEYFELGIDGSKQLAEHTDRFRGAEHQVTRRPERIVEQGKHAPLDGEVQINEQVTARDQVEPSERGIAREVVAGKDAQITNPLGDLVTSI